MSLHLGPTNINVRSGGNDVFDDVLEVPNGVWDNERNNSESAKRGLEKITRQSGNPPSSACLNVKLIFNNGWVQSAGNGDFNLAKQRARDVLNEAENIYNTRYPAANRLGTSISFNLVGGGIICFLLISQCLII